MKIVLASDHAGFELKEQVKKYLNDKGIETIDLGTNSTESVDYPKFGIAAGNCVMAKEADYGVVICGSGVGISIAANKVKGIRCALLYDDEIAKLAKQHNDANMVAFGARFMSYETVIRRLDLYLASSFEGGRHEKRVNAIKEQEGK